MKKYRFKNRFYYILAILIGLILTPIAIITAYKTRGYFAIGSEYLIIPLLLGMAQMYIEYREIYEEVR